MKNVFALLIIAVCALAAGFAYWHVTHSEAHRFRVTFLNVGQGDAALIQFRNGQRMLVDCGPDKKVLSELGNVLPWYERRIDYLVVTHAHADHYAGCIDVLARYRVTRIITNGEIKHDPLFETFARSIKNEPSSTFFAERAPETLEIAGTQLHFLAPDPRLPLNLKEGDSNNASIVFRLVDSPSRKTVLFTGDMEEPLETAVLKRYCNRTNGSSVTSSVPPFAEPCPELQAEVLKAGHHGSDTSSGEAFIGAVSPKTAVISVGVHNAFGHPSLRVIRRLERRGVKILRTDKQGAIVVD